MYIPKDHLGDCVAWDSIKGSQLRSDGWIWFI